MGPNMVEKALEKRFLFIFRSFFQDRAILLLLNEDSYPTNPALTTHQSLIKEFFYMSD